MVRRGSHRNLRVISLPRVFANPIGVMARRVLVAGLCSIATVHGADSAREALTPQDDGTIPQPLKADAFEALMMSPPFTRSLGISDSLILTGIARLDNSIVATVLDTQSM